MKRPRNTVSVSTRDELETALNDANVTKVLLAGDIDLGGDKRLHWKGPGRRLSIESADPRQPRTLTIAYQSSMDRNSFWAGLTFTGGQVTVERIHVKIKTNETTPRLLVAGLALQGAGKLTLKRCEFDQEIPATLAVAEGARRAGGLGLRR